MENKGSKIHIKELSDIEYKAVLIDKLFEEVTEIKAAVKKEEITEEIADVLEVIDAICNIHNIKYSDIENCKQKKLSSRGGFYNRQYVTLVEHKPDSFGEKYCLNQPEKYPEVIN